ADKTRQSQFRAARDAKLITLKQHLDLRWLARKIDPLTRCTDLPAALVERPSDELVRREPFAKVDLGLPGRRFDPSNLYPVELYDDGRHRSSHRSLDDVLSGHQTEKQREERDHRGC